MIWMNPPAPPKADAKPADARAADDQDQDEDADEDVPNPMDEFAEQMVVLVPVTSYAELVGNFEVKAGAAGGIDEGQINEHPAFFKDVGGGYAAMAPKKELLETFESKPGNAAAFEKSLGAVGRQITDSDGLFIIVNVAAIRPMLPDAEEAFADAMADNPAGMAIEQLKDNPAVRWVHEKLLPSAQTAVIGVKPEAMGVGLDFGCTFAEGSEMAKTMTGKGDAAGLTAKLPNQPFLFTFALDLAAPSMKTLVGDFMKLAEEAAKAAGGDGPAPDVFMPQLENAEGAAMAMGAPPGGLLGGVFTSTTTYTKCAKPEALTTALADSLKALDGKEQGGMVMHGSYEAAGAEVDGTKVDVWTMKIEPGSDSDEMGQMAMVLPMIFGPGGPGGYVAKVNGGVVRSYAKNSLVMGAAIKAAQGGDNLGKDKSLAQVGEKLPSGRVAEAYVGVKSIFEAVLPLMAMGGMQMDIELPANMPPIGAGLATLDGGVRLGIFVPAPVIQTIAEVGMQAGAGGEFPGGEKKVEEEGAGRTRF
jgi:hypothetical protein